MTRKTPMTKAVEKFLKPLRSQLKQEPLPPDYVDERLAHLTEWELSLMTEDFIECLERYRKMN
jgi:hypothetical protein